MKLKNIISIVTVSGLLMFVPSCTDLEETLYNDLSESNISYTDEEIESMSGPVYTNLRYTYWAWEGLYDQCEESGDLIMPPGGLHGPGKSVSESQCLVLWKYR